MSGSAPLHAAARGGSADAVKILLDAGADTEARDGNGWTALRVSSSRGFSMLFLGYIFERTLKFLAGMHPQVYILMPVFRCNPYTEQIGVCTVCSAHG